MNKLIIIGNGFDLAHGLETRYSDFILWLANKNLNLNRRGLKGKCINFIIPEGFDHNDIRFTNIDEVYNINRSTSLKIEDYDANPFLQNIISKAVETKWVDIEREYYEILTKRVQKLENNTHPNIYNSILNLNIFFNDLKDELVAYLSKENIGDFLLKDEINDKLLFEYQEINYSKPFGIAKILNFNYTNFISHYLKRNKLQSSVDVINIHGELNNSLNPIIFGYGDEMDLSYQMIERHNKNDLLRFFKSFSYAKTKNYQNLFDFLSSGEYNVTIIGHSCGLSDRVLLNKIFENEKCQKIKIYFKEERDGSTNFDDIVMELSRHFSLIKKHDMRLKITSHSESLPLIKNTI